MTDASPEDVTRLPDVGEAPFTVALNGRIYELAAQSHHQWTITRAEGMREPTAYLVLAAGTYRLTPPASRTISQGPDWRSVLDLL
ncbi:hypothetical protein BCL57_001079 [Agromyces flavus]|uniref:Uncharacterized protein n=1 Tax=Agromyces flavus TaxID=589382 RepID=A0A1H1Z4W6_9MICO|nr:hypothetical protein [Agromyces flavus]MCP2366925.1 hypothetical protein [Agromyces flavus]GGI46748.1 hypothetical protein GCM10010932_16190 [Agromyces flavus]SDT28653.1 hypothetical protein SAMN04489721_3003 [Agromyces flavus]